MNSLSDGTSILNLNVFDCNLKLRFVETTQMLIGFFNQISESNLVIV